MGFIARIQTKAAMSFVAALKCTNTAAQKRTKLSSQKCKSKYKHGKKNNLYPAYALLITHVCVAMLLQAQPD